MKSLNKVQLIGALGNDPEIRTMQNGKKVCSFSLATSEQWPNKETGEIIKKTVWHRIVIFNEAIVKVAEKYLVKGAQVYLEGQIEGRSYTGTDGTPRHVVEIVLRGYSCDLNILSRRKAETDTAEDTTEQDDTPEIEENPAPNVADPAAAFNAPPVDHAEAFFGDYEDDIL